MIVHTMTTAFVYCGVTMEEVAACPVNNFTYTTGGGVLVLGTNEEYLALVAKQVPAYVAPVGAGVMAGQG